MASSDIRDDLEPVLNLTPLVQAADTIRSFCKQFEKCADCPVFSINSCTHGCYFQRHTPETYDIGGIIYKMTEDIGKKHKSKPRKEKKT